jgi:hypothetical protein
MWKTERHWGGFFSKYFNFPLPTVIPPILHCLIHHPGLLQQGHLRPQYQRTLSEATPGINKHQKNKRTGTEIDPSKLVASLFDDI